MRDLLLFVLALLPFCAATGQNVYFSFTDGGQQSYALEDVRKATFTDDVMNLHLTDGTIYSWNISTVDHYTYGEGLVTSVADEAGSQLPPMHLYPNPTTGQLTVNYNLDARMPVSLEVRDLQGRTVRQMELGIQPTGAHTAQWDGLDSKGHAVAAGTYLCRIVTPRLQMSRTFIVL
jgi:hypothetical protein